MASIVRQHPSDARMNRAVVSIAYLNGAFTDLDSVRISPLDRGFLFGDGVYEVIPCYGGAVFRIEQHLKRLESSLTSLRIENPYPLATWNALVTDLAQKNGGGDQLLYIQVTRGVAPRDHAFPETEPTVFAMSRVWARSETPTPVNAIVGTDNRWSRCDIKSVALVGNVLLRQEAVDGGATENILLRDGYVSEGAASNVFVVSKGAITTPPAGPAVLRGVTRDVILELSSQAGMEVGEHEISEQELREAEEIWITSSSMELKPVVELDGIRVGGGQPGPVWMEIFEAFRRLTRV